MTTPLPAPAPAPRPGDPRPPQPQRAGPLLLGPAEPAPPAAIDAIAAGWLSSFAAAERALRSCTGQLTQADAVTHLHRLQTERKEVATLLEEVADGRPSATLLVHCLRRPTIDIHLLGLPSGISACIFDLEGVLTTSPEIQRAAWSDTLDPFLLARSERLGRAFVPFDPGADYEDHLAGRPRLAGLAAFLASRGIGVPDGEPSDPPDAETLHGLGNRKLELLHRILEQRGVNAYAGSLAYLEVAQVVGARRAVVSASANTTPVLRRAGLAHLVEQQVDGLACVQESLAPRPAPDMLLAAGARLGVDPAETAVFETTPAGIAAARAGGFRLAVGVTRHEDAADLQADGADLVVNDLGELLPA